LRIELSITELKEIYKLIPRQPEDVLKLIKDDLPRAIGEYLSGLIRLELEVFRSRSLMRGNKVTVIIAMVIISVDLV
jgi:hypothetical protein